MAAVLTELWLKGAPAVRVRDRASAAVIRAQVREAGRQAQLSTEAIESLAIVASELAANQLDHARYGEIAVRQVSRSDAVGLELVAVDQGSGIIDCAAALRGDPTGARGGGLPAVLRLAEEVDIDVRVHEGTCIRARKFATPPRQRWEIGILGRPLPGGQVSADAAYIGEAADDVLCALVDGAGHGPEARRASLAVLTELHSRPEEGLAQILRAADRAASGTRGAVLGLSRIHLQAGQIDHACVGDVEARLVRGGWSRSFTCSPGMLGDPAQVRAGRTIRMETEQLQPGTLMVVYTDGIQGRWDLASDRLLQRQHPLLVAEHLVQSFSRGYDDALVLVARWGAPSGSYGADA